MPRAQELGKLLALVGILLDLEDALEGSFLRYGLGDLGDLYRDRLTLRQLWVRVLACPGDAPLWVEWRTMRDKAEAERKVAEVEDVLSVFTRPTVPRVMRLEHDMSIAGHEDDCTICQKG